MFVVHTFAIVVSILSQRVLAILCGVNALTLFATWQLCFFRNTIVISRKKSQR